MKMRIVDVEPVIRDLTAMKTELGFDALLIDAMIEGLESQPVVGTDDTLRNKWISVKGRLPETAEIVNKDSQENSAYQILFLLLEITDLQSLWWNEMKTMRFLWIWMVIISRKSPTGCRCRSRRMGVDKP